MLKLKHLDLFSGIGAFSLAARELGGIETTQFVEIELFCQKVLAKNFKGVPIHGDVTTFTATRGQFALITAGFPCQDLSAANHSGRGLEGERSGLFFEVVRLLRAIRPQFLLLENVPNLFNRGFDRVLWEISESGYDAEWQTISAASVGAPHLRERLFLIAYPKGYGQRSRVGGDNHPLQQSDEPQIPKIGDRQPPTGRGEHQGAIKSGVRGMDDGLSPWMDRPQPEPLSLGASDRAARLKALGNSIVPQCAAIPLKRILDLYHQNLEF